MSTEYFRMYDTSWPIDQRPIDIELYAIEQGGYWENPDNGEKCGMGLFHHYRAAQSCCWPDDDHHRWSDQTLEAFTKEEIIILMGSSDSSKTWGMAKFILIDYWAFPEDTLWLISSTEYRGAELRVWGAIKKLFNRARKKFPDLGGNILESKHAISTDEIDEKQFSARSLTQGLILVPMKKGGTAVGLSAYIGIKSPRLRYAGDEISLAPPEVLDAFSNWYGKEAFKGIMAGNPMDPTDPLCTAAEPVEGWDSFVDTEKTQTWRSRWFNAFVIALDGRDSPNFDFPFVNGKPKYSYLIGPKKLDAVTLTYGKDSWQYFQQCIGKPNKAVNAWRVLTRAMCEEHHASESVVWQGDTALIELYGLDPAYGGGDRCVGLHVQFGFDVSGRQILRVGVPDIIPIVPSQKHTPEDQIAYYVAQRLKDLNVPPQNCFYDSFGRGTLGFAFARHFGNVCPVPVDSGAKPTRRPVRFDLFVTDPDGRKRHKRCDEHYSKFITEMWFSIREAVESGQIRELRREIIDELAMRNFKIVAGNRTEIEPKEDLKERLKRSCDLADCFAVAVEGARQRAFKIRRAGEGIESKRKTDDWLEKKSAERREMLLARDKVNARPSISREPWEEMFTR